MTTIWRRAMLRPAYYSLIAVSMALLAGWMIVITWLILEQSQQNGRIAAASARAAHAVEDCTLAGGACYEESLKRTRDTVIGISESTVNVVIAALICYEQGPRPSTEQGLRDCITNSLKE